MVSEFGSNNYKYQSEMSNRLNTAYGDMDMMLTVNERAHSKPYQVKSAESSDLHKTVKKQTPQSEDIKAIFKKAHQDLADEKEKFMRTVKDAKGDISKINEAVNKFEDTFVAIYKRAQIDTIAKIAAYGTLQGTSYPQGGPQTTPQKEKFSAQEAAVKKYAQLGRKTKKIPRIVRPEIQTAYQKAREELGLHFRNRTAKLKEPGKIERKIASLQSQGKHGVWATNKRQYVIVPELSRSKIKEQWVSFHALREEIRELEVRPLPSPKARPSHLKMNVPQDVSESSPKAPSSPSKSAKTVQGKNAPPKPTSPKPKAKDTDQSHKTNQK